MIFALAGLILFLIFMLVAIRVGVNKDKRQVQEFNPPIIHKSGIYSIVRKSPRENVAAHKPSDEEIAKYLATQNEDIQGSALTAPEKTSLIEAWKAGLEASFVEIEEGDKKGTEYYYYTYSGEDPVCRDTISKGQFVTREQLFHYPSIIPPFHLGCRCELKCYRGEENLRETTVIGMRSLFNERRLPQLPNWKKILKISQ